MSTPASARRLPVLARAWFGLALLGLGLSALFAVFLVVARTPFLGQGAAVFRTALVLHVDLAVLVWFLAMAAGLWVTAGDAGRHRLGWGAFALAAAGGLTLLGGALPGAALPLLSNYIPLLDHPVFLAGLGLFGAGIALAGLAALPALRRAPPGLRLPAALAIAAFLLALTTLTIDLGTDTGGVALGIDDLLWGVGHGLQFVHILLLMAVWQAVGQEALDKTAGLSRALPWLYALAFVPALAGPAIALAWPVGSVEYRSGFTLLMRWGTWPGAALFGIALSAALSRLGGERDLDANEKGLMLSLFLFLLGCLLGSAIRGDTLAVPAHYHATVGAVTLAFLVWLRREAYRMAGMAVYLDAIRRLPLVYGSGIGLLVGGLAIAGQLGIPRKAPHVDIAASLPGYYAAMGIAGLGGFLAFAAIGGMMALGLRDLYRRRLARSPRPRRDARLLALGVTAALVALGGWLLEVLPGQGQAFSPSRHAAEKIRQDIDTRFQQGVFMLHARQYDHALTAFHRVLQLAPTMPEAYVNMGYALLGLKRYKEAYDFFDSATMLRRSQANAYYGMAVALEGMGDIPAALGAMRTFLHLTKANDPFRIKAETAIWEWETKRPGAAAKDTPRPAPRPAPPVPPRP